MASFAEMLAADRRLVLLRTLTETNREANEMVLKQGLDHFGHRVASDMVRADMAWLAEQGLIRIEKLHAASGELWLAHLLRTGEDVAEGRARNPGVARREAE